MKKQQLNIKATTVFLREKIKTIPSVLLILGSGFTKLAEKIEVRIDIPFQRIPGLVKTNAPTHTGRLLVGRIAGKEVLIMQGRYHAYEGYEADFIAYPVRVAADLGVKTLITTNLSGGINEAFKVGDFMAITDHLNLSGKNPLFWTTEESGAKFIDMYQGYSPQLIDRIDKSAAKIGITLRKGVLAYLTGPNFETKAELKMLKLLGADAVGWSLVPEVMEARRQGMEVLGIVCISDISNPENFQPVNLKKIYQAGEDKAAVLLSLLENFLSSR